MFYDAIKNDHGLELDPIKSLVIPRPIGWISSLNMDGVANLAPYSFFNLIADSPAYVAFSSAGRKDSLRNIEETGEFVCNLVSEELRDAMNMTSINASAGEDEFILAQLAKADSQFVKPPRVEQSLVALECHYAQTVELAGHNMHEGGYALVVGKVVGIYINDALIADGRVDIEKAGPIARLGYRNYSTLGEIFKMTRPD